MTTKKGSLSNRARSVQKKPPAAKRWYWILAVVALGVGLVLSVLTLTSHRGPAGPTNISAVVVATTKNCGKPTCPAKPANAEVVTLGRGGAVLSTSVTGPSGRFYVQLSPNAEFVHILGAQLNCPVLTAAKLRSGKVKTITCKSAV